MAPDGQRTLDMKGMWMRVYGLMSLISTWVLIFRNKSANRREHNHCQKVGDKQNTKTHFQLHSDHNLLTFYVFSDERVLHDVPPVRLQDFLELGDVIVLIRTAKITFPGSLRYSLPTRLD